MRLSGTDVGVRNPVKVGASTVRTGGVSDCCGGVGASRTLKGAERVYSNDKKV